MSVYLSEDQILTKSKREKIIEKLKKMGELHYGGLISH